MRNAATPKRRKKDAKKLVKWSWSRSRRPGSDRADAAERSRRRLDAAERSRRRRGAIASTPRRRGAVASTPRRRGAVAPTPGFAVAPTPRGVRADVAELSRRRVDVRRRGDSSSRKRAARRATRPRDGGDGATAQ